MSAIDLILGASVTTAPLPPVRPLYVRRFTSLVRLGLRGVFETVEVFREEVPADVESAHHQVVYCNHPGFWDPLVSLLAVKKFLPSHRLFAPIDIDALDRHWYFRGLGFFGVEIGTARGFKDFSRVCQAAFSEAEPTCLVLTPEGHFRDPQQRPLRFLRGLAAVLAAAPGEVCVRPMALDYRMTDNPRLRALARVGQRVIVPEGQRRDWQSSLERELEKLLDHHQARIAEGDRGENLLERVS